MICCWSKRLWHEVVAVSINKINERNERFQPTNIHNHTYDLTHTNEKTNKHEENRKDMVTDCGRSFRRRRRKKELNLPVEWAALLAFKQQSDN